MEVEKFPDTFKKIEKEVIIFSLISVFLYQSVYFFIFFLIPLQLLRNRKGFLQMMQAAVIVSAITLIACFFRTNRVEIFALRSGIIFSEVLVVIIMLLGFLYINYNWQGNPRMLKKLVIVTIGAFFIGIPVLLTYNSTVFQDFYKSQIAVFLEGTIRTFGERSGNETLDIVAILKTVDAETVYNTIKVAIMRSYLFLYFILLSASWWLGSMKIIDGKLSNNVSLKTLSIPQFIVWPLIIALTTVVLDHRVGLGFLGYIGWNMLLIIITLYGLRGIGIIQSLFLALNVPRFFRVLIYVSLLLFLLQPGLNFIVLVAVPGLGVSEIWINYKNIREKKYDNENNS
ncbi:MAG: YybS family protein [Spirochaetaceae bacterium]|nr:YybS family protein [Spirochaetaceae bacterium]